MDYMDKLLLNDKLWDVLCHENANFFSLEDYNILPIWNTSDDFYQYGIYHVNEFQLFLNHLSVSTDREYPKINGISPDVFYTAKNYSTAEYENIGLEMDYSGAILLGFDKVYNYDENVVNCYDYKEVCELVFLNGRLVTTIDHTRGMRRIRKNLDLGLRDLKKKRDRKCIRKFIQSCLVGNYKKPSKKKVKEHKIQLLWLRNK